MNIKKIKELIELMNDNDLTEVEVEQEGMKIKLMKKVQGVVEQIVTPVVDKKAAMGETLPEEAPQQSKGKEVKAPMVGTFYRSASPETDPYVEVGDVVQKGDVLCIVEAMKLMNEVKAEFGSKIVEIAIENAEPVEYGQTMFFIKPV